MDTLREECHQYDDIINLPHHVSKTHAHMPVTDRAAQFSPFAALTGYEDVIREEGRLTDAMIELDEGEKALIDTNLRQLIGHEVEIRYFLEDKFKAGGSYEVIRGEMKKIDTNEDAVVMKDGTKIPVRQIVEVL